MTGYLLFISLLALSVLVVATSFEVEASFDVNPRKNRRMELMLPTRDGTYLHTIIILPRETDETVTKYTAIVDRSPYGYGDMEWITDIFLPFGFVAVGQDMRGTEKSQGNFTMWMSDSEDSVDLGNWIVQQPWSNGQIYTFGASADGIGALQTVVNNPSWLGAQYLTWCTADIYSILFSGGAYKQETTEDWLLGLEMPNPDAVYADIKVVHEGESGYNAFWDSVNLTPEHYSNIKGPSAFWGGWYDIFEVGLLATFENYNTMSDPSVRHTSKLTVDPCGHCLESAEFFTQNSVQGRTALVIGQLFEVYGIHAVSRTQIKNITFYVMSSNDEAGHAAGQYWTSMEDWPRRTMTDYYFHADGTASTEIEATPDAASTFKYDPSDPVPTMGGNNLPDSIGGDIPCGPLDQSGIDQRPDVLKFQTAVFSEELALTGPLLATLFVSSDAIDTDFMVRVSDVYPTGEARLIQDSAVRMRWRGRPKQPVYMQEGAVYEIEVNLWNTSYVLAPVNAITVTS